MTKPIKPLSEQIEEYKNQMNFTQKLNKWDNSGETYALWNWNESWDGQLIKDVIALEQAGFTIVSFSRKRKVTLNYTSTLLDIKKYSHASRLHIMRLVEHAELIGMDSSWYSISFKPTLSIYWKGRSSSWNY